MYMFLSLGLMQVGALLLLTDDEEESSRERRIAFATLLFGGATMSIFVLIVPLLVSIARSDTPNFIGAGINGRMGKYDRRHVNTPTEKCFTYCTKPKRSILQDIDILMT